MKFRVFFGVFQFFMIRWLSVSQKVRNSAKNFASMLKLNFTFDFVVDFVKEC